MASRKARTISSPHPNYCSRTAKGLSSLVSCLLITFLKKIWSKSRATGRVMPLFALASAGLVRHASRLPSYCISLCWWCIRVSIPSISYRGYSSPYDVYSTTYRTAYTGRSSMYRTHMHACMRLFSFSLHRLQRPSFPHSRTRQMTSSLA
jgi:hypothetical protein